jgi:1-acyl-sn-glycerol-3-phosphate acyltransferase
VSLLYRSLRQLLRLAVDLYFVDIESTGREKVPRSGPVIFAANHPNSIMDTVILGTQTDRQIHYMARSGLFKNPVVATIFDRCGVIPIYKKPKEDGGSNEQAFASAYQVLAEGGCIGIFPEGQNSREREVLRVKTGTARIALGAEKENEYELGVKIVPVGLNFENRDRFMSKVLLRFGDPIDTGEYAQTHQVDDRQATEDLTERISDELRQTATHIEGDRVRRLVEYIWRIYGNELIENMLDHRAELAQSKSYDFDSLRDGSPSDDELADSLVDDLASDGGRRGIKTWLLDAVRSTERPREDLEEKLWAQRRIADALAYYEEHDPGLVTSLQLRIWSYVDHVRQVRLKHDFLERPPETLSSRKEGVKFTAYAIAFAIPAIWGLIHNFAPYQLTKLAVLKAPDEAMRAITGLLAGALAFPLFYGLYAAALWWATDGQIWFPVAYVLSLIPTGFFFLRYRKQLSRYRGRILTRTLFRTEKNLVDTLIDERRQIVEILDDLRDRFRDADGLALPDD